MWSFAISLAIFAPLAAQELNPPAVDEALRFMEQAEAQLLALSTEAGRAAWVQSTYITLDTEILAALAHQRQIEATVRLVKQSRRFDGLKLPPELERKMIFGCRCAARSIRSPACRSACSSTSGAGASGRLQGAASPLLDLWQPRSWPPPDLDARNGPEPLLARGA